MDNNIATFEDFTKENVYTTDNNGNLIEKDWFYYKDFYPEKYDFNHENVSFVWIIKNKNDKKIIIKGDINEDNVKKIIETLENDMQLGKVDRT